MNKQIIKQIVLVIYFSGAYLTPTASQSPQLKWEIGYHKTEQELPTKWVPASVPGAVQLDIMKAEKYRQPWYWGDNVKQFDWMEDVYFTYKTDFKKPDLNNGQHLYFFSKGIDYQFKIILNGQTIWEQEGMFSYVDIDLTDHLNENNELKIIIFPVPDLGFSFDESPSLYRRNARQSAKPAVSYGWDWHPRLVTRGIWDDTRLVVRNPIRISDLFINYDLNNKLDNVFINANITGIGLEDCSYKWSLIDPEGKVVLTKEGIFSSNIQKIDVEIKDPVLWWPSGYGDPNMYQSKMCLIDKSHKVIEEYGSKIGFRQIKLVMNEGEWDRHIPLPVTRNRAPACLEVNNIRIFAKGTNWVHPEVFVGTITHERYLEQILLAKNANFNILRVWGGGIVNKESFFNICDEQGILVWQEFPLACNYYPNEPKYLNVLKQEARSIVERGRNHPCLAIWSGGNELFNSWSGMTEQSFALRLLNSICYELDPKTPFIYTSPAYGMGHGHYLLYDKETNEEVFQWMPEANKTAYTEFGVPGVSNLNVLKSFIPEKELFPPKSGTTWEIHHAMGAWREDSWLEMPTLEKYFGTIKSLEELVQYSQLIQCEGLKYIYEEARRQKPYCSMALNWCYQEPWPSAVNNSIINWPNEVKPAYYHVANACRSILASIRIPKFEWKEGENFACDLFMLNDSYKKVGKSKIKVSMQYDGNVLEILSWNFPGTENFKNLQGPTANISIPKMKSNLFSIHIEVKGHSEFNSSYILLYKGDDINKVFPSKEYYEGKLNAFGN
ncbi:glycoside hydrolase family 2 protein [Parabacteroides sp. Marseille-P3160]|uniref:glycoside hydrolase family 2 protein n=1 Tax=Parabacteroides sp. Marseille-P3160 TaxID=1917887 RepID=UPI0013589FC7|nr:glycoside hydrolase family 2 TIM barrel-domain containing protein [Parabacteroides sp. Marseille-P3160]